MTFLIVILSLLLANLKENKYVGTSYRPLKWGGGDFDSKYAVWDKNDLQKSSLPNF